LTGRYGESQRQKYKSYCGRPRECEKLLGIRESVVSTLTLIHTSRVLYALARLIEVWGISKEDA
jgi:hypothetical protein